METEQRNAGTPVHESLKSSVPQTDGHSTALPTGPSKSTPRIDFPELRCQSHRMPIILVSDKPNMSRIFFCSRCLIEGNKDIEMDKLLVFEDFVHYLATPPDRSINMPATEEALRLAASRKESEATFNDHINGEQKRVQTVFNELNGLYDEKCKELVHTLENVLDGEQSVFKDHYVKFENQVRADKEKEAQLDQFTEIRERVSSTPNPADVEEYIRDVIRRKQAWEKAGLEFKTLGKRSEDYYRSLVETQLTEKPTFSNAEQILSIWKNGLDRLITEVRSQSGCVSGTYRRTEGIVMEIRSVNELRLLTNAMVKEDTDLIVNFERGTQSNSEALDENSWKDVRGCFERLTNLRYLTLNFSDSRVTATNLREVFAGVNALVNLRQWTLNIQGNKLKNTWASVLATEVTAVTTLETLSINCSFNDCSDDTVKDLAGWLTGLKATLRSFTFNANANSFKSQGAERLGQSIQELTGLEFLDVNFGGFSQKKNAIKDEGFVALVRGVSHLQNLRELRLDVGHNSVKDTGLVELALTIKSLHHLTTVNFQLYTNSFEARGAVKVSKALVKRGVTTVTLNLQNNQLGTDGVNELVGAFRVSAHLTVLDLNLRETEMGKNDGKNLRSELNIGKVGTPFERLELHVSTKN